MDVLDPFEELKARYKSMYLNVVVAVASLTLLFAEYLQTLDLEVSLVWPVRWGFVKILYLVNRIFPFLIIPFSLYYNLVEDPAPEVCRITFAVLCMGVLTCMWLAEGVLYIRVYALSGQSPWILTFIVFNGLAVFVGSMTLLGRYVFLGTWEVTTQPTPPGCFSSLPEGQLIMIAYVLVLYSGFMTMILCLYYGFRMYWTERETGRLIKIFYRDGAIYFVILSAMSIANAVAALFLPSRYRFLLAPPQAVAHSTLSIRMILHLREGARKQMGFGTNEPRATMTWEWSGTTTSQPFMATPYRPRA